jgi:hypothetical protein
VTPSLPGAGFPQPAPCAHDFSGLSRRKITGFLGHHLECLFVLIFIATYSWHDFPLCCIARSAERVMQTSEAARPHPALAGDDKTLKISVRPATARKPTTKPEEAASMGHQAP